MRNQPVPGAHRRPDAATTWAPGGRRHRLGPREGMMNHGTRVMRRNMAIIAAVGLALLAAACGSPSPAGSGGSPSAAGSAASPSLVGFSHCMRSHGVPNWPDPAPDSLGRVAFPISISKDGFDPNTPQIGAKENECGHVVHLPVGVPLAVSP